METTSIRLGVDFDNTIVCYDQVFHQVALQRELIPPELPVSKAAVRDFLRTRGREDDWTQMQGFVYGSQMKDAQPFPGVLEMLRNLVRGGVEVFIVSHKTRHPYQGPKYDLHQAAGGWLQQHGMFDADRIGMPAENAFFELTLPEKIQRIADLRCTHFVDDLPELLGEPDFPANTAPVLFDPNRTHAARCQFFRMESWNEMEDALAIPNGHCTRP